MPVFMEPTMDQRQAVTKKKALVLEVPVIGLRRKIRKTGQKSMDPALLDHNSMAVGLNAAENLVPLPARPKLHRTMSGDLPVLVVDLAAPADAREAVRNVMNTLKRAGFKQYQSWDQGPLALPPKHWGGYLLWPSRVAILANRNNGTGMPRKFLLEPFRPADDWHKAVKKSPNGSLGLLVGDLHLSRDTESPVACSSLEERMSSGAVLGCVLLGTCTT
jgi:hypothetical protein